jgi:hypothetical protein
LKLELKRPEKTVEFCLDGGLYAEYAAATRELEDTRKKALARRDDRLTDPSLPIAKKVVDLAEQIRAESIHFLLRALTRKRWQTLVAENPSREGNAADKGYGFNLDAVLVAAIPESIVSVTKDGEPVEFTPAEDWEALADEMTDRQYEDFGVAVLELNRGRQEVPFSLDAYRKMLASDQT